MNGGDVIRLHHEITIAINSFQHALEIGTQTHIDCLYVFPDDPLFTADDKAALEGMIFRLGVALAAVEASGGDSVFPPPEDEEPI